MKRQIIINESDFIRIASRQFLEESGLSNNEVVDAVVDALKNNSQVGKELDKKVKNLVASCVNMLFKTLWQRRNFYEDEIKK